MSRGLPVPSAAEALGVSLATLRRWMRDGCPVARRGRRGRGCKALVDPVAVQAWLDGQSRGDIEAVVRTLAGQLPEILAASMAEAFRVAPDKRNGAWIAAAGWQLAVFAITDALRDRVADLPDPEIPEAVDLLRKIAMR